MKSRTGRFALLEPYRRDGELAGVTLLRCTWWFQVTLAVAAWSFGYSIERTWTLNPRRTLTVAFLPGLAITVGIER